MKYAYGVIRIYFISSKARYFIIWFSKLFYIA